MSPRQDARLDTTQLAAAALSGSAFAAARDIAVKPIAGVVAAASYDNGTGLGAITPSATAAADKLLAGSVHVAAASAVPSAQLRRQSSDDLSGNNDASAAVCQAENEANKPLACSVDNDAKPRMEMWRGKGMTEELAAGLNASLINAVNEVDQEECLGVLQQGADPNTTDENGNRCLHKGMKCVMLIIITCTVYVLGLLPVWRQCACCAIFTSSALLCF